MVSGLEFLLCNTQLARYSHWPTWPSFFRNLHRCQQTRLSNLRRNWGRMVFFCGGVCERLRLRLMSVRGNLTKPGGGQRHTNQHLPCLFSSCIPLLFYYCFFFFKLIFPFVTKLAYITREIRIFHPQALIWYNVCATLSLLLLQNYFFFYTLNFLII